MFLGIDIGTSSVKAVLINESAAISGTSSAELNISRPKPLWSEQDPLDWWQATNKAVSGLDPVLRRRVKGIGLSGQMHGATLLDDRHKPLRPAILWNDGRSFAEAARLQNDEPSFFSATGNLVMPGFTAPKVAWIREHEPEVFSQINSVLLPKDYIRLWMTGELASDMSDSAGTLWMDIARRSWDTNLLESCGLKKDQMPQLFEGPEETGCLRLETAEAWGMASVPVVAGGGDNAAGAIGAGVVNDGDALMSLGTSGVIFVAGQTFRANPSSAAHAFCHAIPERWHLMSVMLSAASCVDWACQLLGLPSAEALVDTARVNSECSSSVLFLPYLSGERTPHNDPHASGVLFGLHHDTGKAEVAQAVLEGVAFGMGEGLQSLTNTGVDVHALSVIGGGAQSDYWGRILAAVLERPLIYMDGAAAGPALGAARLARYASLKGTLDEAFEAPAITNVIEPHDDDVDCLAPKKEKFSRLYQALQHEFENSYHA
ncbi:MAG: xylulokinase [Pseudomonadota bacterium]